MQVSAGDAAMMVGARGYNTEFIGGMFSNYITWHSLVSISPYGFTRDFTYSYGVFIRTGTETDTWVFPSMNASQFWIDQMGNQSYDGGSVESSGVGSIVYKPQYNSAPLDHIMNGIQSNASDPSESGIFNWVSNVVSFIGDHMPNITAYNAPKTSGGEIDDGQRTQSKSPWFTLKIDIEELKNFMEVFGLTMDGNKRDGRIERESQDSKRQPMEETLNQPKHSETPEEEPEGRAMINNVMRVDTSVHLRAYVGYNGDTADIMTISYRFKDGLDSSTSFTILWHTLNK